MPIILNDFFISHGRRVVNAAIMHKTALSIVVLVIAFSGYFGYLAFFGDTPAAQYIFAKAEKGTLIVSLTGSGQVSASSQVDIKPKVSGEVIYVGIKNGQEVGAQTVIAQIDSEDAKRAAADAEINLESALLALEKLKKPADTLSALQAENALASAQEAKEKAEDDLKKSYESGFNDISDAFLDLPAVTTGLEDIFFDSTIETYQAGTQNIDWYANQVVGYHEASNILQYKEDVYRSHIDARKKYLENFEHYKIAERGSEKEIIEKLIFETYETAKALSVAVKNGNNYIDFVKNILEAHHRTIPAAIAIHESNLDSYTGIVNDHIESLFSSKRGIEDAKKAIVTSGRAIAEKTESLAKLKAGPDVLDIRAQEIIIRQRESLLEDAQRKLANYSIRVPFSGIITNADVKKGDQVSSTNILATLLTRQKLAEISLNEVDVAKVNVGQKATLTFDAIPDLTITGQVAEIDTIGTVSQGVVTYTVKIAFDTQDDSVKPSMSVSAAIITGTKLDVILVPNAAIKSQGGNEYVEIPGESDKSAALTANAGGIVLRESLHRQPIDVGVSNDEFTEVVGGIKEGEIVMVRTVQTGTAQTAGQSQNRSLFQVPGQRGGGIRTGGGAGGR
ncbi:MAG: HlyD family efflux transporter periplasmic adaptor subunit [Candidatus Sungbacteria bacterium]|nr:HlyD family efflux transporter periplasmic adaptor subunit [Candidatus Sungbacteria bacterium]